jgi:hypothetical protein
LTNLGRYLASISEILEYRYPPILFAYREKKTLVITRAYYKKKLLICWLVDILYEQLTNHWTKWIDSGAHTLYMKYVRRNVGYLHTRDNHMSKAHGLLKTEGSASAHLRQSQTWIILQQMFPSSLAFCLCFLIPCIMPSVSAKASLVADLAHYAFASPTSTVPLTCIIKFRSFHRSSKIHPL